MNKIREDKSIFYLMVLLALGLFILMVTYLSTIALEEKENKLKLQEILLSQKCAEGNQEACIEARELAKRLYKENNPQ